MEAGAVAQDDLVQKQGKAVRAVAGCIFGPGEHEKQDQNKELQIPAMLYKAVIIKANISSHCEIFKIGKHSIYLPGNG